MAEKKKKSNNSLIIILAVLLVIIVAAYFLFFSQPSEYRVYLESDSDDFSIVKIGSDYSLIPLTLSGANDSATYVAMYRFKISDLNQSYRLHLKCLNVSGSPGSLRPYIISDAGNLDSLIDASNVWSEISNANLASLSYPKLGEEFEVSIGKENFANINTDYIIIALKVTNSAQGNYYVLSDYSTFKPYLTIQDW